MMAWVECDRLDFKYPCFGYVCHNILGINWLYFEMVRELLLNRT